MSHVSAEDSDACHVASGPQFQHTLSILTTPLNIQIAPLYLGTVLNACDNFFQVLTRTRAAHSTRSPTVASLLLTGTDR